MRSNTNVWCVLALMTLTFGVPAADATPPEGKGRTADSGAPPHPKPGEPQSHDGAGKSRDSQAGREHEGQGHGSAEGRESDDLVRATIDREAVRRLVLAHRLMGRSPLPPGIRRNLARGKPLPPGIARHAVPASLLRSLPHHDGYEWLVCGTDLVLIVIAGAIVADVIMDAFE